MLNEQSMVEEREEQTEVVEAPEPGVGIRRAAAEAALTAAPIIVSAAGLILRH